MYPARRTAATTCSRMSTTRGQLVAVELEAGHVAVVTHPELSEAEGPQTRTRPWPPSSGFRRVTGVP